MMPRSARIHSTLVPARIATRSSPRTPRSYSPAAIALARSPTWPQVSRTGGPASPGAGLTNASRSGVAATLARNMSGTDRYCRFPMLRAASGLPACDRRHPLLLPKSRRRGALMSTGVQSDRRADASQLGGQLVRAVDLDLGRALPAEEEQDEF